MIWYIDHAIRFDVAVVGVLNCTVIRTKQRIYFCQQAINDVSAYTFVVILFLKASKQGVLLVINFNLC
jgi:hypothetical protein